MKYLFSLVLIVGLVGCGDGASSLDGNAAQTNSPPQSDDQPNPDGDAPPNHETDADHNTDIDDKPDDDKSNPATSVASGTGQWTSDPVLIGAWSKEIGGLAMTYTFKEGGEGSITGTGVPPMKLTWKTDGTGKLQLSIDGRQVSTGYAVTGDTLRLSPPKNGGQNDGPQMVLKRSTPSKHPAELAHAWKTDRILSKGLRQTMVLGKSGDLVLTPKEGKAAKGKWEVDGNRIKLMFVDPVSGDERQQEFSFAIGGSEIESEDGKITNKRANLFLNGIGDNKTSITYERPLPSATTTDEGDSGDAG